MNDSLRKTVVAALLIQAWAMSSVVAENGGSQSWPSWRGPDAKGCAVVDAAKLMEDPSQAKLVWESEAEIPPSGNNHLGKWTTGWSSPCVADGRVFLFWYEGDEHVIDPGVRMRAPEAWQPKIKSVGANEIVLCVDAETGKTLWKKTLTSERWKDVYKPGAMDEPLAKGTGVNLQASGSGKTGGHFSLAVADGMVFAIGTTSRAFCLDAATGKQLWDAPIGVKHAKFSPKGCTLEREDLLIEALKKGSLKGINFPEVGNGRAALPNACPAYADGVVFFHDTAFEAKTGKVLWQKDVGSGKGSPVVWTVEDKAYFICGAGSCVEPRTGRLLWSTSENVRHPYAANSTVAVEGQYMAVKYDHLKELACYEIGPAECKRLWALKNVPRKLEHTTACSPVIHDGHLYLDIVVDGKRQASCVDLATGKALASAPGAKVSGSFLGFGPFIAHEMAKAGNGPGSGLGFFRAGPENFGFVGALEFTPFQDTTTPAVVGTRIYIRGGERLLCYDMREMNAKGTE